MLFLLSACNQVSISNKNSASIKDRIDNITSDLTKTYEFRPNNTLTYYTFYLPSDMQENESFDSSMMINYLDSKIAMNLNVASIVDKKYYIDKQFNEEGFFDNVKLCYEKNGVFTKDDGNDSNFVLKIYQDKENCLVHLVSDELNFYCSTNENEIEDVVKHIFLIAKSVEVDTNAVISNYSAKEVIDYQKKQVDLFDYVIPSSGYLSDLVNSSSGSIVSEEFEEKLESEPEENEEDDEEENNNENEDENDQEASELNDNE